MNQISFNIELDSAKVCQALRAFLDVWNSADDSLVCDAKRASSSLEGTHSSADERREYEKKIESLEEIRDDLAAKISKKDEEIKSLKQKLDGYVPDFTNKDAVKYLRISADGSLERTTDKKAPYMAIDLKGGVYYQFNIDGLCKDACRDWENTVRPFCDIEEQSEEADGIKNTEPGKGEWDSSSQLRLKVMDKARVKLIKQ